MAPGLFLGWRIDPGMRYRNVVRVLDYQEFRNKRNSNIIDVPEPELYIEDGPPVFPVANATHKSLVDGSILEGAAAHGALPDIPLRDFPLPPEDLGLPPLKDPKARGVYITVERVIKFGETISTQMLAELAFLNSSESKRKRLPQRKLFLNLWQNPCQNPW